MCRCRECKNNGPNQPADNAGLNGMAAIEAKGSLEDAAAAETNTNMIIANLLSRKWDENVPMDPVLQPLDANSQQLSKMAKDLRCEADGLFDQQKRQRECSLDDIPIRDPEGLQTPNTLGAAAAMAALIDGTPAGGIRPAIPSFCSPPFKPTGNSALTLQYNSLQAVREQMLKLSGRILTAKTDTALLGSQCERDIHADFFHLYALMSAKMEELVNKERSTMATQERGLQLYYDEVSTSLSELENVSRGLKVFMNAPENMNGDEAGTVARSAEITTRTQWAMSQAGSVQQADEVHLSTKPAKRRRLNRDVLEKNIGGLMMLDDAPVSLPACEPLPVKMEPEEAPMLLSVPALLTTGMLQDTPAMIKRPLAPTTGDKPEALQQPVAEVQAEMSKEVAQRADQQAMTDLFTQTNQLPQSPLKPQSCFAAH